MNLWSSQDGEGKTCDREEKRARQEFYYWQITLQRYNRFGEDTTPFWSLFNQEVWNHGHLTSTFRVNFQYIPSNLYCAARLGVSPTGSMTQTECGRVQTSRAEGPAFITQPTYKTDTCRYFFVCGEGVFILSYQGSLKIQACFHCWPAT